MKKIANWIFNHIYLMFWSIGIALQSATEDILFHGTPGTGFWDSPIAYTGLFNDAWHAIKQLALFIGFAHAIYFYKVRFPRSKAEWREFDWKHWLRFIIPILFLMWIVHQVVFHYIL